MSNTLISLRALRRTALVAAVISPLSIFGLACTSSPGGKTPAGAAGTTGAAGDAAAGTTGTAGGGAGASGTTGSAGTTAGAGASGTTGAAGTGAAGTNADGGATDASLAPFDGFGENVIIFDPAMSATDMQAKIDAVYADSSVNAGQFATTRTVYLFKPGAYQLDVKVGYYNQVLGLGASPDDVAITGAVRSMGVGTGGNATLSFWRAAENVSVTPAGNTPNVFAVSQGAWLRRMHVKGALNLADSGNSSGGYIADSKIDGKVTSASQQQYFTRNTEWMQWQGGVWNMVFVGDPAPPAGTWPTAPLTVVEKTPVAQEKPFLTIDGAGKYSVVVPASRANAQGASWTGATAAASTKVPLEQFYVARAGRDSAAAMNLALSQGKHLLLEPGIYHLEDSLRVTKANTIVLGLGFATLAADTAAPAITVAEVDGVKIAGLIVDAGPANAPTLIQVGTPGAGQAHAAAPTWLYDLTCRVGGGQQGLAATCLTIDSGDVVGDDLWLWRADHGANMSAGWTANVSKHGLVVNGKNVTMYGLFVEHFQEYQTVWNGEGGRVYFYQSEMPYDPPTQDMWTHDGVNGYASYKVGANVTSHEAWGVGVYCAFRSAIKNVVADRAIEVPASVVPSMHHLVTVWLNGDPSTQITHVLNDMGAAATMANRTSKL
ncbi:MAG TPA: coagulation factor 5/8 type domain-containing protein [Polyangia bacterium]|nr:coagulation factor 5/8 type domain-containing protein [Polyangia bacterium]